MSVHYWLFCGCLERQTVYCTEIQVIFAACQETQQIAGRQMWIFVNYVCGINTPANTRRLPNVELMLDQHQPNIGHTSHVCWVFRIHPHRLCRTIFQWDWPFRNNNWYSEMPSIFKLIESENVFNSCSAATAIRRQNLTSVDVRFWRPMLIPECEKSKNIYIGRRRPITQVFKWISKS